MNVEELIPHGEIIEYKKGEIVRYQDEPINEVLVLLEGTLGMEYISESGKILKIDFIKPVRIIASGLIFSKEPRFPVNVVAESDTKILEIKKELFLDILMKKKDLLRFFLQDISEHFKTVSQKLFFTTTRTLKEKLLQYILQYANEDGEAFLPLSIEELSKVFGCTRPALSRVFQELTREKIIEKIGRKVKILKPPYPTKN
ncbi:MAG: Crp/Fnr family transcriptional regulator [Synergistetes bacterium]|nr:Crp/Fnr family transcriptional regulator [Synergistota bacterium]MDW8192372.1 Crp/Fnr family transcriptional regulator [Synergistota bacterium]